MGAIRPNKGPNRRVTLEERPEGQEIPAEYGETMV